MEIILNFGSYISATIEKQLNRQGYTLGKDAEYFEELRWQVNHLVDSGVLKSNEEAFKNLHKLVSRCAVKDGAE